MYRSATEVRVAGDERRVTLKPHSTLYAIHSHSYVGCRDHITLRSAANGLVNNRGMDEKTDRLESLNCRLSYLERKIVRALEIHFGTDASSVIRHGVLNLGRSVGITHLNVDELLKQLEQAHKKKNAPKH